MHLLITAVPGAGKTTAIRRLAEQVDAWCGFYTEEIRRSGERQGFRLIAHDGTETVIAHVNLPKAARVGKYGVDVEAMDRAAKEALAPRRGVKLYLVDEIGKMECLSAVFISRLRAILDGRATVVATVAQRGEGFIAAVKRRRDCELWTLDRANRDTMPQRILNWLAA
jgi:nucleoside-triphosphatase